MSRGKNIKVVVGRIRETKRGISLYYKKTEQGQHYGINGLFIFKVKLLETLKGKDKVGIIYILDSIVESQLCSRDLKKVYQN